MRRRAQFTCIGVDEAERIIARGEALTVDVRDPQSFRRAHIAGAQPVSMSNISNVMAETAKDRPILIYCYHGHASREYAQVFTDFGFSEVYSLDGGYEAWKTRPKSAAGSGQHSPLQQWLAEHAFPTDDINATIANGMTPLMTASHGGEIAVIGMLIAAGASLEARNGDGNNALWLACVGNHLEVIDLLVDAGIDVDNRNETGATSLMYAASSGRAPVVERLLAKGADAAPETPDGFSALDLASNVECLNLLRRAAPRASKAPAVK